MLFFLMNKIDKSLFCFEEKKQNKTAIKICNTFNKKYTLLDSGRNRLVFKLKSGNYVLKFPLNEDGVSDNDWEASTCSNKNDRDRDEVQWPKTRYIEIEGFICCIMEYIEPITSFENKNLPDWINSVDGGQVGYNKKGLLLAYDYGLH